MSNKLLVALIGVFFVIILLMGGGFFFMWKQISSVNAQNLPQAQQDAEGGENQEMGPIFPLKTFIVNLADEGGNRYLRVTMNLELGSEEIVDIATNRLPQIRNSILMTLPTKKYDDIHTLEGKTALRDEIIAKLNGFLSEGTVTNIYFTEFVVQ